jgi:hemoglobin
MKACNATRVPDFEPMKDIETTDDVRLLVDEFYGAIRADALLNPIFTDVAQVDWAEHLPKMYAFWNGLILGVPGYAGRPFPPHTVLPVGREHFQRWVALFHATVDRHFSGPGAQRAKDAAASIAHTFAMRMGVIDPMAGRLL